MTDIKSDQTKIITTNGGDPINVYITETETITDNGDCVTTIKTETTKDNKDRVIGAKTTKTETTTSHKCGITKVKTKTETLSDSMGLGTNETGSTRKIYYGIFFNDWDWEETFPRKSVALTIAGVAGVAGYLLVTRGRSLGPVQQLFRRDLGARTSSKNNPAIESKK